MLSDSKLSIDAIHPRRPVAHAETGQRTKKATDVMMVSRPFAAYNKDMA